MISAGRSVRTTLVATTSVLVCLLVAPIGAASAHAQTAAASSMENRSHADQPLRPLVAPATSRWHAREAADAASLLDTAELLRVGTRTRPATPPASFQQSDGAIFGDTTAAEYASTVTSSNWSGYVVGAGPYTAVTGTFTVPQLLPTQTETSIGEWVGIDGVGTDAPLIQAGVGQTYDPITNLATTSAWWEILPAPTTLIPSMTVSPGDSVTVTIGQLAGTLWAIGLTDNTTGQTYTTDQTYSGPQATAEWIVEAPTNATTQVQDTLAAFSPLVTFSDLRMTGPETTLEADTMVQSGMTVAVPSALTTSGFTVTYVGPTATPPTPPPSPSTQVTTITRGQQDTLAVTGGSPYLQGEWQESPDGVTWSVLTTFTLDASGASSYTFAPTQTAYYRTFYPSLGQYGSPVIEIIVLQPSPPPTSSPTVQVYTITLGDPYELDLSGGTPGLQVQWQVSSDDVAWSPLTTVTLDTSGGSAYAIAPTQTAYYRIYVPSSGEYSTWTIEVVVRQPPSIPRVKVLTLSAGQGDTLSIAGGTPYLVVEWQTSTDLVTWSLLATVTLDSSGASSYTFTPTQTTFIRAYYPATGQYGEVMETIVQPATQSPPTVSVADGSALGLTTSGPFSTTTKVQLQGRYVTWKFSFGQAAAGHVVRIWLASRSGTAWSSFAALTSRIADSNGDVYFHWRYAAAKWISLRASLGDTFAPARQVRWT